MSIAEGRDNFYFKDVINNTDFATTPTYHWKTTTNHIILVNDAKVNSILFSFNGEDIDGELFPRDKSITMNWKKASRIWLKVSSGVTPTDFRLWAWID